MNAAIERSALRTVMQRPSNKFLTSTFINASIPSEKSLQKTLLVYKIARFEKFSSKKNNFSPIILFYCIVLSSKRSEKQSMPLIFFLLLFLTVCSPLLTTSLALELFFGRSKLLEPAHAAMLNIHGGDPQERFPRMEFNSRLDEKIPPETNHSGGRYSVLCQSANSLVERERSFSTSLKIRSIFFCSIRTTFPEAMS